MSEHLKFELSRFEHFLNEEYHPEHIEATLSMNDPEVLKADIAQEAKRVCHALRDMVYRCVADDMLERNIKAHQQDITHMLDEVYAYLFLDAIPLSEAARGLYLQLKASLRQVLNYIERDMNRYFDLGQRVPDSFRIASARQMQQDGNLLESRMKGKMLDLQLQTVLLQYFKEHCELESCSYAEQRYAKLVMENLLAALSGNEKKDWDRRVVLELVYLNFNKSSFFQWCRKYIAADVEGFEGMAAQMERLNWYLKEIEPLDTKPNVCCKAGRDNIKALLTAYISAELGHLAECMEQDPATPGASLNERANGFDFKLPLNLTVPQLGMIVQLFMDVGVFIVEKGQIMTVMRFFAENVRTKGTGNISVDSLNKHRNLTEAKVCEFIEHMLLEMLRVLRTSYMA